jgi:5-methylcytosine-specific restriction endonuclease McrA
VAHYPRCVYCGVGLTRKTITRDHVIPSSRGGESGPDNLVPACARCNRAKGDRSLLGFLVARAGLDAFDAQRSRGRVRVH